MLPHDLQLLIAFEIESTTLEGLRELLVFCQVSKYLYQLSQTEEFWQRLYQKRYPQVEEPPQGNSWRESYRILAESRTIELRGKSNDSYLGSHIIANLIENNEVKRSFSGREAIYGKLITFEAGDRVERAYLDDKHLVIAYDPHLSRRDWKGYLRNKGVPFRENETTTRLLDIIKQVWQPSELIYVQIPYTLTLSLEI